jgi:MFS family permease
MFLIGGLTVVSCIKILASHRSIGIVFLFHTSNGTVLPLVMQTLAIGSGRSGILLSGLCIIVAQIFMVASAKICGDYSGRYGRKTLFLIGLFVVPIRCLILTALLIIRGDGVGSPFMQFLILSTQVLDGVGAGVFGTMYILVTSDISGGTGRFSMTLGLTTAAMSIGGTVSGYLGEALAQDIGYKEAFFILAIMSLVPAIVYLVFMPETLAELSNKTQPHELGSIQSIQEMPNEDSEKPYVELT